MNDPLNYIEISRNNLLHNLQQFKNLLPPDKKIAAVVKANAYGHGSKEITRLLNNEVDYFQVDNYFEFLQIESVVEKPILILGYVIPENLEEVIVKKGIPVIYDTQRAKIINNIGKGLKKKIPVHLKIDSFLGRQGLLLTEVPGFLKELKKLNYLKVRGIYSHFSNADQLDEKHTRKQADGFKKAIKQFQEAGYNDFITHMAATSGVLEHEQKNNDFDLVRLGIGLYGYWPSKKLKEKYCKKVILKPVLQWISHIIQIKDLPANYPVSYNLTFVTKKPTKVGIIPQGYSDGFDRKFSNLGKVLVNNSLCPILGRVAMNIIVIDVSNISNISPGQRVILLGNAEKRNRSATELAKEIETINYEIISRINPLLPRVVV